jgi:lysophospholipid acyltransferase (LPLAT)-like uncharacterized protein
VIPHQARPSQRCLAFVVYLLIRVVAVTLRWSFRIDPAAARASARGRVIYAIWHNGLAMSLEIHERLARPKREDRRMAVMVSASRDGGFLSRIIELFKVQPVRGSSSRRGPQALRELVTWAEQGYDLAITPDGPRGPRYVVQEGTIALAQLTGLPVIPAACLFNWRIQLRSWDRFLVPLPFSRCDVSFGEPVVVPRECSDAEREALRKELEHRLIALSGN